ncbi:peptidase inhibitor family I36 protein [Hymenobacter weizhouensis]|uniref:peptidase inhibitor family I36 protein n=1 Tax=Hymenobacter sp. YIM 151500-1 TaxID=2987689 RepID=UPI00222623F6|nr:peptidase inhibitor family I36 protein [Hymenobacter sp. YIM 151500-1]UYZ63111.1 T9SS type A sorting domain-containing protein [Hymenobacter sp. YIM 151500-1]
MKTTPLSANFLGSPTTSTRKPGRPFWAVARAAQKLVPAAAGLLLATTATAQVTVFQNCDYAGRKASFGVGSYPLSALTGAGLANDDVSSVLVTSGYQVTFYADDNYQGAALVKTSDTGCLTGAGWNDRASSFKVEKIPVPAPPTTWQEHWFDHNQLLSRVYYDDEVAVYYDKDVSRSITWPNTYLADVWRYTKQVYGSFGGDSRLYAVFHTGRYSGGHPATYFDAHHDYRNTIDGGPGPWTSGANNDLDLMTHEVAHIVEGACKGVKGSPAFGIWKDSKWAEIFNYDVYRGLGRTSDATRWYNLMIKQADNFPRSNTYWFRDWFYPIYSNYGEAAVLNRYFELLAQYYTRTNNKYGSMNWGEFVHFWSGAAGVDLKPLATQAFGWPAEWEQQFAQAQRQFPFTYGAAKQVLFCQHINYGGYAVPLAPGRYTTAALATAGILTNDLSSVRVPAGYEVRLYDNGDFTGASLLKTADDASLVDDGWNDRTSSIVVQKTSPTSLAATKTAVGLAVASSPEYRCLASDGAAPAGGGPAPAGPAAGELRLFPNPATTSVVLTGLAPAPTEVGIYDKRGVLRHTVRLERPGPEVKLNCATLEKGTYLIRVSGSKTTRTYQFVKQ